MRPTGGALAFVTDSWRRTRRRWWRNLKASRRHHHREDRNDGTRQLGGGRSDADAGQLQRGRRAGIQPVRPAHDPRDARSTAGPRSDRRLESGVGTAASCGRQRRHRNIRIDPEPGEPEHARRHQADGRPRQPLRRDSDHRRPGHAGTDRENRARCRDPAGALEGAAPDPHDPATRSCQAPPGAITPHSCAAMRCEAPASGSRVRTSTRRQFRQGATSRRAVSLRAGRRDAEAIACCASRAPSSSILRTSRASWIRILPATSCCGMSAAPKHAGPMPDAPLRSSTG